MSLIKRAIVANRNKALPAGTSTVRIMFHEVERAAAVRLVFDLPVVPRRLQNGRVIGRSECNRVIS